MRSTASVRAFFVAALAVATVLSSTACGVRETPHPTPANVVAEQRLTSHIRETIGSPGELADLAAGLRSIHEIRSIPLRGAADAPSIERIDDVWVSQLDEVFILDAKTHTVAIADGTGRLRTMTGPAGERPSQFDQVRGLFGIGDGKTVMAGLTDAVAVFTSDGHGYDYVTRVSLGGRLEGMCSLGDDVYVRVPTARTLVTRLGPDGARGGAFGEPYKVDDPGIRALLSQGMVACAPGPHTVVAMFNAFPEIYGFGADGSLKWISRFEDFRRPRLVEVHHAGQTTLVHSQTDLADRLMELVAFKSDYVIAQILRFSPDTKKRPHEIHSFVLDARTGRGEYIGAALPLLVAARESTLYAEMNKPSLRLAVYAAGPPPSATGLGSRRDRDSASFPHPAEYVNPAKER